MVAQDSEWKHRVRTIEINVSHSLCPSCTDQLLRLHGMLANAGLRSAVVQLGKRYDNGRYPTTAQSIGELRGKCSAIGP